MTEQLTINEKKQVNNRLLNHCRSIADDITNGLKGEWVEEFKKENEGEEPTAYDYLNDALSIDYIIGSDGVFKGAEVLVTFGGPNITINTRNNKKC